METSPLLRLPAELRNHISEEALLTESTIHVTHSDGTPKWKAPALLQSCQHIRREARGVYFAQNRFAVTVVDCNPDYPDSCDNYEELESIAADMVTKWASAIGTHAAEALQKIYMDDHYHFAVDDGQVALANYRQVLTGRGQAALEDGVLFVEVNLGGEKPLWYSGKECFAPERERASDNLLK